jgi:hypothetical protein
MALGPKTGLLEASNSGPIVAHSETSILVVSGYNITQEKSRNSPELFSKLPRGGWLCRLPQSDRISLRVVQAGEPAVGIRLRVNLDRDSSGSQLACHFVEIPDSKVQHPDLVGSLEKVARLRLRIENGGSGLLLPNGILVARWRQRDPQMLPSSFREERGPSYDTCADGVLGSVKDEVLGDLPASRK